MAKKTSMNVAPEKSTFLFSPDVPDNIAKVVYEMRDELDSVISEAEFELARRIWLGLMEHGIAVHGKIVAKVHSDVAFALIGNSPEPSSS